MQITLMDRLTGRAELKEENRELREEIQHLERRVEVEQEQVKRAVNLTTGKTDQPPNPVTDPVGFTVGIQQIVLRAFFK